MRFLHGTNTAAALARSFRTTIRMATRCFTLLVLFLALSATANAYVHKCTYTFFVKTGDKKKAGTDSQIGLTLGDSGKRSIEIPDLTKLGLMGKHYNYLERGNLDIFSGRETCLEPPICSLKLASDLSGKEPGWFVDYVEIAISRPDEPCTQITFPVNQWLGSFGHPSEITVFLDGCSKHINKVDSATEKLY